LNNFDEVNSLRDRLKNVRKRTGTDMTILLRKYFIDGFLYLLSQSEYQKNFIWKGGFVLSAITGIQHRTTVDLDTMLQGVSLKTDELTEIINEIIDGKRYDGVSYLLIDIQQIQEEKDYTGQRVRILATIDNLKDIFHLDIATGETLVPNEIAFSYKPLLGNQKIPLLIYRPERILSEKLQTVLYRGILNTRMRDFYDIYVLNQTKQINFKILQVAFSYVIKNRHTSSEWENWQEIISLIRTDKHFQRNWQQYANKHSFVKDLSFDDVINTTESILENLSFSS